MTIADVAARAGVSAGAVSFALNGRPGVAASTRRRILDVAGELGWQPSHRARSLSRSTSFAFALVLARGTELVGADPFFPAFVAGLNTVLVPHERSLLFTVVPDTAAELDTYRRLAAQQRVDGVILPDLRTDDPRPRLVADLGLPAITLGRPNRPGGDRRIGSVSVNDVIGMHEVVRSLVTAGHERIAHVTGPRDYLHVRHRRRAWADELDAAALPRGRCVYTDFSAGGGAAATETLIGAAERPTAITYTNDVMAIAGLAVIQRHGLRVPHDISITGFDDTELAHHLNPPLTTVRTAVAEWGRRVALELLGTADGGAPKHIDLDPARMVVRGSVAAPPPRRPRKGATR